MPLIPPWLFGILYGVALFIFGFLETISGKDHGTGCILFLASSPLIIFPPVVSIFGCLAFWPAMGILLTQRRHSECRHLFDFLFALHYICLPFVFLSEDIVRLHNFHLTWQRSPKIIIIGLAIYVLGQLNIWFILLRRPVRP